MKPPVAYQKVKSLSHTRDGVVLGDDARGSPLLICKGGKDFSQ